MKNWVRQVEYHKFSDSLLHLFQLISMLKFQVKILFSDKTGTLTKNEMILQQCSINGKRYIIQNFGIQEEDSSNVIRLPQYDRYMLNFFETLSACHTVQVAKLDQNASSKDGEQVENTFEVIEPSASLVDIEEDKRNEETLQNTKINENFVPNDLIDSLPIAVERKKSIYNLNFCL